jgi:hypothetical protein
MTLLLLLLRFLMSSGIGKILRREEESGRQAFGGG